MHLGFYTHNRPGRIAVSRFETTIKEVVLVEQCRAVFYARHQLFRGCGRLAIVRNNSTVAVRLFKRMISMQMSGAERSGGDDDRAINYVFISLLGWRKSDALRRLFARETRREIRFSVYAPSATPRGFPRFSRDFPPAIRTFDTACSGSTPSSRRN